MCMCVCVCALCGTVSRQKCCQRYTPAQLAAAPVSDNQSELRGREECCSHWTQIRASTVLWRRPARVASDPDPTVRQLRSRDTRPSRSQAYWCHLTWESALNCCVVSWTMVGYRQCRATKLHAPDLDCATTWDFQSAAVHQSHTTRFIHSFIHIH